MYRYNTFISQTICSQFPQQSGNNPTNLHTWFGGSFWSKNEERFVDTAPIPFSWESGNQLMKSFLKTEASLILKTG